MPFCVRALREKGSPADLDAADIVEIKHSLIKQRTSDAIAAARRAMERNPKLAYSFYVSGLSADSTQSLKATKKGLKCTQITPFVRHYMLWRAVEHAGNMGVSTLQEAVAGQKDYAEGLAFLMSSCEDAKTFISEAPPDNRNMQTILNWYIICTIAVRGSDLSPDLREFDDVIEKLKVADQFSTVLGYLPRKTQIRLARQLIVESYGSAVQGWSDVLARFDSLGSPKTHDKPSLSKAEDDLTAWLEDLRIDDEQHGSGPMKCTNSLCGVEEMWWMWQN
ncbi:uncharacterized protein FIBRA_02761 [Fibroporia radiculosa]|uniref:Uncharacterized protein n=1 Tax=Fibroporia radiculosa TaxID=599839 RepID=J4I985_9APHY|nr:uncharacterized protein FIBRA_02761 [Fibroporia radiculosa]CCM00721.1 predicted protein [Fibroporia radiculosa]